MRKLPSEILVEVVRQQELMGWPEMVPAYAEYPDANGNMLWDHFEKLNVAICEQLVEHHSRKATKALNTYQLTHSTRSLRSAGKNILYARLYRCRYLTLLGKTDSTEADMPFPITEG